MQRCTLVFPLRGTSIILAPKLRTFPEDKESQLVNRLNGYGGKEELEDENDICRTAVREFEKEANASIAPDDLELVAIVTFYKGGVPIYECHVFFLYLWEGKIQATPEMGEPEEHEFLNPPFERMMPGDSAWLRCVIEGERRRWNCYYSDDMKTFESLEDTGPLE